jgi:2-methylcitrate dehydratase PrpD
LPTDARLADVLKWLWEEEPPAEVQAKAKLIVLDTIGCVLAASGEPKLREFAKRLAASEPGAVCVPGFPGTLSPSAAAALFAAAACWHEACEGLARAHGRPGVPVIATCSALAQMLRATLGETVKAIVAGYETGARLGEAIRMRTGMHVDATWPGFGVAAAAVRLSGGSAEEALAAIRTAACQMPHSLYRAVSAGAEARNTYLAHSAQLGLLAANAALAGFTAPDGALDEIGAGSFAAPGEWLVLETYLKPFAAVRHVHYGAAAALALRPKLAQRLERISRIELRTYAEALTYCRNRAPRTPIQAQFSLSYGVARALARGSLDPDAYAEDALVDPLVQDLEAKVVLTEDPELTRTARRGAVLAVRIEKEILEKAIAHVPGDPAQPMTRSDVVEKFARYARRDARAAAGILDAGLDVPYNKALEALG